MGDITVDPKGVAKLLEGLNVHKASGRYGLNATVLKECSNEISPILALIYNEFLSRGNVPDECQQANVSPVFKKGEKYDVAIYRQVSPTYHLLQNPRPYFSRAHPGSKFFVANTLAKWKKL